MTDLALKPALSVEPRTFSASDFIRFSDHGAQVNEIVQTDKASIVAWCLKPQQRVEPHFHPDGQDSWILLKGELTCFLGNGQTKILRAGDVTVAKTGEIHGAVNSGSEEAVFISVYSAPVLQRVVAETF